MSNLITTAELAELCIRHSKISVKEFQEELNKPTPKVILDQRRRLIEDEKRLGKARRKWRKYFSWDKCFRESKYKNLHNAIRIKHIGV